MTNQRVTPRTWANQEFMTAALLNVQLRDASEFLKSRPFENVVLSAVVNTTSTSFAEITETRITLTCTGGNVMMAACGIFSNSTAAQTVTMDIAIDGTRYGDTTVGLTQVTSPNNGYGDCLSLIHFTSSAPSVGDHVFSLYWKVSANQGSFLGRFFALEIR